MRSISGLGIIGVVAFALYAMINGYQAEDMLRTVGNITEQAQNFVRSVDVEGHDIEPDDVEDDLSPELATFSDDSEIEAPEGFFVEPDSPPSDAVLFSVDTRDPTPPSDTSPPKLLRPGAQTGSAPAE